MKTVSDFKKALQVGTKVHTIYHCESKRDEAGNVVRAADGLPEYADKDLGTSPVTIVQTTQFAVERVWKDGTKKDSWCKFPKASDCEVKENTITIFEDNDRRGRVPVLTYTIVKEEKPAPVNLDRLFVELMPSYGHVLNALPEDSPISKQDFIKLFSETFNTSEPRTNLLLHAIKASQFETIKRKQGSAIFNE